MDEQKASEHPPREHMLRELNLTLEYRGAGDALMSVAMNTAVVIHGFS